MAAWRCTLHVGVPIDRDGQPANVGGKAGGDGVVDEVFEHLAVVEVIDVGVSFIKRVGVRAGGVDVERAEAVGSGDIDPDVGRGALDRRDRLCGGSASVIV